MAIILPGPGTPQSGSFGTMTFSRNRYGAYIRNRTSPVNPNSARQNAARAAFRNAVSYWTNTLSGFDRSAWNTYAAATPWINAAGETVNLTGQAMFIRYFAAWASAGVSPPANVTAPIVNNLGSLDVTATEIESSGTVLTALLGTILINNTWAATGGRLLVEITPGQNLTRDFPGSRWASAAVITGAGTATHALSITLTSLPFGVAIGQRAWLRVRGIQAAGGNRVSTQQIIGPLNVISA